MHYTANVPLNSVVVVVLSSVLHSPIALPTTCVPWPGDTMVSVESLYA
jgi:hypothetical protein